MDASTTQPGGTALRPLPQRTAAPVRHADRLEFLSAEWIDAVRDYLEPRVAERRDALRGKRTALCEIFTDAPPHLGYPDNVAAFHIVVDDGELTVAPGALQDADYCMRADYNQTHVIATAVFADYPERQARMGAEAMHRHGDFFEAEGALDKAPPALLEAMAGMHDALGRRTVTNPDIEHRIDRLGMRRHVEEIEERGYTVVEGAVSDALVDRARRRPQAPHRRDRPGARGLDAARPGADLGRTGRAPVDPLHRPAPARRGLQHGPVPGVHQEAGRGHPPPAQRSPAPADGRPLLQRHHHLGARRLHRDVGLHARGPGSHKWHRPPDPDAMDRAEKILMPKGSVALWHGSLWHGSSIRQDEGERLTIHNTYLRNWVRTFDSYLEIDPAILERNPPTFTTLCGIDDLYGKNTYAGPDFSRVA